MLRSEYDVVVIGCGPAGSTAARFAAAGGASVLILERDREPGIPVRCGEGVPERLLQEFLSIDKKWISSKITEAQIFSPDGASAISGNNGTGYILERRIFDAELANIACEAGADLITKADATGLVYENNQITGVKYRYMGKEELVVCKLVIGADGVESRVGRWAGIKTDITLKDIHTSVQYTVCNLNISAKTIQFHFGNKIAPGGYAWVFPKSSSTANIGVGVAADKLKENSIKYYLDKFINEKFPEAKISCQICGGIPLTDGSNTIYTDGMMLVGDAARQINPITGGGIFQGMIAGKIAGELAAEAVKKNRFDADFLVKYRKAWDKKLGNVHKLHYKLKQRFYNMSDERYNRFVAQCKEIPADKSNLKTIFLHVLKNNPAMLVKAARGFLMGK